MHVGSGLHTLTRALFCAHPQAAVEMPTASWSLQTSSGGVHTSTVPGAQQRLPENAFKVVHACTSARPSARVLLHPGEVEANSSLSILG